jgi:hypothetical protein
MPIHAQSDESESEIGSENPAVCANQIPVDQHFANQIPDESNLQNVQTGNFFLASQMGNQGQIGQIWPESQTGCHNQGEGAPPPYESDDDCNQNFGEVYARNTLIEMGLLPKPSFCRNPFLSEINGDVDRQSRDSHSGPGTPLLFLQPSLPVDPEGPEEDVEMENSVPSDKTSSFYEGGP